MRGSDLYFILNPSLGIIKIGIAADVKSRLSGLECSCGVPLEVLRVVKGGAELETPLHDIFGASRLMGEWFHPTEELLALAFGAGNVSEYVTANKAAMRAGREAREDELQRRKAAQDEASRAEREAAARLREEEKRIKAARKAKLDAADKKREAKRRELDEEKRDRIARERREWAEKSRALAAKVIKPDAELLSRQRQAVIADQRSRNAAMVGTVPVDLTPSTKHNGPANDGEAEGVN